MEVEARSGVVNEKSTCGGQERSDIRDIQYGTTYFGRCVICKVLSHKSYKIPCTLTLIRSRDLP